MTTRRTEILKQLKALSQGSPGLCLCTVESIDENRMTCQARDEFDVLRTGVRLMPIVAHGNRIVVVPKIGSVIICLVIGSETGGELVCIMVHDPESVEMEFDEVSFQINSTGIKINGDELGGIVKAKELKSQIDKNTQLLEKIKEAFIQWLPAPSDGGAALKALSAQFSALPTANLADIENSKVMHG